MSHWKGKSRGGAFGYRFFILLIHKSGIRFTYFFLAFVVCWFIVFAPSAVGSVWFYSRKILKLNPVGSFFMLFRNFYAFGQTLIDKVAIRGGMASKYRYEFENYEEFLNVLNSDTGVIMIGAHVGNWEAGGTFFGDYASKMNVVMFDVEYEKIKKLIAENSQEIKYKIIPVSENDLGHVYAVKDALDRKEYVCFQGDRFISEKTSFKTNFMGREAKFPFGPFKTAAVLKAPVVFYFSMREKGMKYKFKFTHIPVISEMTTRESTTRLKKEYIRSLEKIVNEYPEQWFNYYKFWDR